MTTARAEPGPKLPYGQGSLRRVWNKWQHRVFYDGETYTFSADTIEEALAQGRAFLAQREQRQQGVGMPGTEPTPLRRVGPQDAQARELADLVDAAMGELVRVVARLAGHAAALQRDLDERDATFREWKDERDTLLKNATVTQEALSEGRVAAEQHGHEMSFLVREAEDLRAENRRLVQEADSWVEQMDEAITAREAVERELFVVRALFAEAQAELDRLHAPQVVGPAVGPEPEARPDADDVPPGSRWRGVTDHDRQLEGKIIRITGAGRVIFENEKAGHVQEGKRFAFIKADFVRKFERVGR